METDDFAASTRIGTRPSLSSPSSAVNSVARASPSFYPPGALEKYLLQAKGLKGAYSAKLVEQATSDKNVFVFAELAGASNVAELAKTEHFVPYYRLIELFAYGTWHEYKENVSLYPPLNEKQVFKLKQLSLITLAAKTRQLPYCVFLETWPNAHRLFAHLITAFLLELMDVNDVHTLENLIIETIYTGLLTGRLDQRQSRLDVAWVVGRDVNPGKVLALGKDLTKWASQIQDVIVMLDDQIQRVQLSEAQKRGQQNHHLAAVNKQITEINAKGPRARAGSGPGGSLHDNRSEYRLLSFGPRTSPRISGMSSAIVAPEGSLDEMDVDYEDGTTASRRAMRGPRKRQRP